MSSTNYETSTAYGGKPYPSWQNSDFQLPGYKNAYLRFISTRTAENIRIGFLVGPNGFTEQRTNLQQINKTMSGWLAQRNGKGLVQLGLSGYMLDTKETPERLDFLDKYVTLIEDNRNANLEFLNYYKQYIYIEGRRYDGLVQGITFSKNGNQPYLYQYNMTFISFNDCKNYTTNATSSFDVGQDAVTLLNGIPSYNIKDNSASKSTTVKMADSLYAILTE